MLSTERALVLDKALLEYECMMARIEVKLSGKLKMFIVTFEPPLVKESEGTAVAGMVVYWKSHRAATKLSDCLAIASTCPGNFAGGAKKLTQVEVIVEEIRVTPVARDVLSAPPPTKKISRSSAVEITAKFLISITIRSPPATLPFEVLRETRGDDDTRVVTLRAKDVAGSPAETSTHRS
jgi:hypothetical protein